MFHFKEGLRFKCNVYFVYITGVEDFIRGFNTRVNKYNCTPNVKLHLLPRHLTKTLIKVNSCQTETFLSILVSVNTVLEKRGHTYLVVFISSNKK